jgi:hypothetical protein
MREDKLLLLLFSVCFSRALFSQSNRIQFSVSCVYGNEVLHLADSAFKANTTDDLQLTELKFYVSKIQLLKKGQPVLEEKNSFHLVDAAAVESLAFTMDNPNSVSFDELRFNLGIDSITNVSGAMRGHLDPTKGMYWTWQSGYINFKLEGTSTLCNTRKNEFTFHLGGYLPPHNCLQTFHFAITNSGVINLKLDVQKVLKQIDLAVTNHIMSPTAEAVSLSKIVANSFSVSEK